MVDMKKLFLFLGIGLVFTGCTQSVSEVEQLPADVVLKKAAQASVLLESARYDMNIVFESVGSLNGISAGEADITGSLHQAGEHIQSTIDLSAEIVEKAGNTLIQANVDLVVLGPREVYLRLNDFESDGQRVFLPPLLISAIKNSWLNLGPGTPDGVAPVTTDPRVLQAQAEVVKVTEELPLDLVDDHITYHYRVKVDNEKLIAYITDLYRERGEEFDPEVIADEYKNFSASGELWIDAENYTMRKLYWELEPFTSSAGTSLAATIKARFYDFDDADPIMAPDSATTPEQLLFFDAISEGASQEMKLNTQENIINSLLNTTDQP